MNDIANLSDKLSSFSFVEMMSNVDRVSDMVRRLRLRQGIDSDQAELVLCRMMLDLKFVIELVDALRKSNSKLDADITSLKSTYERMLAEKKEEIESLKNSDGRNL